MQITKEHQGALNALIRIEFAPEDYQHKVDAQLKEYSKKVQMPGFRPGKVPSGMVRKMYGKSVLVDELNKLTSDTLMEYIREQQLDILGNPLPHIDNDNSLNLDNPGTIRLAFEIGMAPSFDLGINRSVSLTYYAPLVDDAFVQKEIENYRERIGDYEEVEEAATGDLLHGAFVELNDQGEVLEGGISKHADVHDADLKEGDATFFDGMKKGESRNVDMKAVFGNDTVIKAILGISDGAAYHPESKFRFTLETVKRKQKADINQEFFDKLFGKDVIFSEDELKARIATDAVQRFAKDSEARFFNEAVEHLVKNANFELPDAFLKRWLAQRNEGNVNVEDIENNYTDYARGIRWQLIENKIIKDFNINVTHEQAIASVSAEFMAYMGGLQAGDEEQLGRIQSIAENMLRNEKEAKRVYDRLYNEAMSRLFLDQFDVLKVELSFDDWVKKVTEPLN
jgi:trigger factor